ncbi:glycosyltransferase [Chitinophaga cymbidii]|uniref:Glycosyl transferase family 1 n=1 Tax=Chitinophaga cymbidii TaxID=1096750 RepID=A0A512RGE4_9BACT|nr:glycosyltransferase [Chitinophaga cymbidii]GEP94783.1 glycosyl transferase family 1 [Chitinophaga cymbidii]
MSKKTLILFTIAFPYNKEVENTFITPELDALAEEFEKIYFVPTQIEGNLKQKLPLNSFIVTTYARKIKRFSFLLYAFLLAFTRKYTWEELFFLLREFHFRKFLRWAKASAWGQATASWIEEFLLEEKIDINNTLLYTYWFNNITSGLIFYKLNKSVDISVVTRAHGGDLYEERFNPKYFPYRPFVLKHIKRVYLISEQGKKYLSDKYPKWISKFAVARLGVTFHAHTTPIPKAQMPIRIVSCSSLIPIKRVEMIFDAINSLDTTNIEWIHFGNGPLYKELNAIILENKHQNISVQLKGFIDNQDIFQFYKNNYIDLFVNASTTEGVPVSIMEAQSFGIPVIAPNIGGISEIVNQETGFLINNLASSSEIRNQINNYIANRDTWTSKRDAIKQFCFDNYDSSINAQIFIKLINSNY